MLHADSGIGPDVRTVEERVPRLDPLRGRAKRGGDAPARIVELARVGLGARLGVGGAQRGDANAERRASPDVRAGDKGVQLLDLTRGKRKRGLDGRAGRARSTMRTADSGKSLTMYHRQRCGRSASCMQEPPGESGESCKARQARRLACSSRYRCK